MSMSNAEKASAYNENRDIAAKLGFPTIGEALNELENLMTGLPKAGLLGKIIALVLGPIAELVLIAVAVLSVIMGEWATAGVLVAMVGVLILGDIRSELRTLNRLVDEA